MTADHKMLYDIGIGLDPEKSYVENSILTKTPLPDFFNKQIFVRKVRKELEAKK